MKRLVFVTYSFPSGIGERWKYDDVLAFSKFFDEVVVLPFVTLDRHNNFDFPANVRVVGPILEKGSQDLRALDKVVECASLGPSWIVELATKVFCGRFSAAKSLIGGAFAAKRTIDALSQNGLFSNQSTEVTLLFFWGVGGAEAAHFIRNKVAKIIVCFHNFDLYKGRAIDGYFPFRAQTLVAADVLAPCSQDGANYLQSDFSASGNKIQVKRLGVEDFGLGSGSGDRVMRVVSCAFASPVKRLHLICESLARCNNRVDWLHIGDGPLLDELEALAKERLSNKENISYNFYGFAKPAAVRELYVSQPFDLFISLSSYEGVPVSIMEALSAGIPVVATDVGGVSELVDGTVGELVPEDVEPESVAQIIDQVAEMPQGKRQELRQAARQRADLLCRAPDVNLRFAEAVFDQGRV